MISSSSGFRRQPAPPNLGVPFNSAETGPGLTHKVGQLLAARHPTSLRGKPARGELAGTVPRGTVPALALRSRHVNDSVHERDRRIQAQQSAIDRRYHEVAGGRSSGSRLSNNGSYKSSTARRVNSGRAANLPINVLGLSAVDQDNVASACRARNAHGE